MVIKDDAVLAKFRGPGPCEGCKKYFRQRDPHHILRKGIGGGSQLDHPWNLLGVCRRCHDKIHAATLLIKGRRATREDLFALVAIRESVPQHVVEEKLYELRRLPKGGKLSSL